jgi:hypothetical protein
MTQAKLTMKWLAIDDVMLCVHSMEPPTETEWKAFIDACDELGRRRGIRGLLALANVSLTPKQRGNAADTLKRNKTELAAVVTESRLTRGAVTAIGWITGVNRAYSPQELDRAFQDLRVSTITRNAMRTAAKEFCVELGVEHVFFAADMKAAK